MNKIDHILVARLVEMYNAWDRLGIRRCDIARSGYICETFLDEEIELRGKRYHYGRIRYFIQKLNDGEKLEPISMDNMCGSNYIYPEPIVIDGHHRLCAAEIANSKKIPAIYNGRIDLLNYLKGRRKTCPQE